MSSAAGRRLTRIVSSLNNSSSAFRTLSTVSGSIPEHFKGLHVEKERGQKKAVPQIRELSPSQLPDFDVTLKVEYSTLNYKDALAITGAPGVVRAYPIVPGIDYAGTVVQDRSGTFQKGEKVILTGHGVGEKCWGGYAEYARAKPQWLVRVPPTLTTQQAMSIGTAGFTAMLCVMALEQHGLQPRNGDKQSKVLVTGASGGVGVTAVALLASLGYEVVASSGREWTHSRLKQIGANSVIDRFPSDAKAKALDKELYDGVIDSVGGNTLAIALSQTKSQCAVAACGLAGGTGLPTTVFPFILRGVRLHGVDSVYYPNANRDEVWRRLAEQIPWKLFESVTSVRPPSDLPTLASELLSGQSRDVVGRTVIDCSSF